MFHNFFFLAANKIMFSCVSITRYESVFIQILLRFIYRVGRVYSESLSLLILKLS
jgi:hypothetical protein